MQVKLGVEFRSEAVDHRRIPLDGPSDDEDTQRDFQSVDEFDELVDVLEGEMIVAGFVEIPVVFEIERECELFLRGLRRAGRRVALDREPFRMVAATVRPRLAQPPQLAISHGSAPPGPR
jgi:hypothetical protein